jgi:O-antigen/teichoic acid export membrane protein
MSASRRIAFAVTISWVSRAISILSGLLLMPILFRFMGKEELGLWFLLGNSQAFLGLLGMGITPTLTRRIAFAKGRSGSHPDAELTDESKQDIGDWVVTGKVILQWLAVIVFFIAWVSGYGLIRELKLEQVSPQTVFWAWTLMCVGYSINVWQSYLGCWLQGIGYVGWDSAIGTVLAILTIITNILAVLMGGGLLALAIISVISGLVNRFLVLGFINWQQPELLKIKGRWCRDYAQSLIKPSLLYWLTDLGAFLILRTDAYFISFFKGVDSLPKYQAAYSLVSNLYVVSVSFASASAVFVSQAWQAGNFELIQHLTFRNARVGLSFMAVGVGFVLSSGESLINVWLGKGNFVGYSILIVFCIMITLEVQHVILVYSARATEDEVYAPWALSAGVLNVIFTWLLIKPLGLLGVAMGTMLAQMVTNNWYAVYHPIKRLKLNFHYYLTQVVSWWALLLISSYSLSWLSKQILIVLDIKSDELVVISCATISVALFISYFWCNIITVAEQARALSKIKSLLRFE